MKAIEEHQRRILDLEGADYEMRYEGQTLILEIKCCSALEHMRKKGYPVMKKFCEHDRIINEVTCRNAGYECDLKYNQEQGKCLQKFWKGKE